jgi:alpha-L-fucosidase
MKLKGLQKAKIVYVTLFVLFISPAFCQAAPTPEPQRTERTKWWREAKFGMFIHWGLYAVPAGEWKGEVTDEYSEWIMYHNKIPVAEYEQLAKRFNPVKFDAGEWVRLARQAGMKYMVITSKHHDGFSMFDSKVTTYDIVDATPFQRDPMKELADACRNEGIKFGFYYSVDRDWHHPDAQGNRLRQSNNWDCPDESKKDFNKYFEEFAKPQIRELLTQYGPLGIIWFDGIGKKTTEQNEEIVAMVRKYQRNCLINSRLGDWMTYKWGDYRSMDDNEVSNRDLGYGWENPGTINHTYGYNKHDKDWKSATEIIHMFVDIASNGGNYLLNIGPKADGSIPAESVRVLQEVGKWMEKYGESIYGTAPGPIEKPEWGRCTAKDNRLYLHVFEWPTDEKIVVSGIDKKVKKVYLLADPDGNNLKFECLGSGDVVIELDTISLPTQALDISDTVIVLETED